MVGDVKTDKNCLWLRFFIAVTIMSLGLTLLFGCTQRESVNLSTAFETNDEEKAETEKNEREMRTIIDMAGREVEIPIKISKVATLGSVARMMVYAGCADRITGLSDLEIGANQGMPYAYVNKEFFSKLTPVASGGAASENYEEALLMLQPDVILTNSMDANAVNTMQEKFKIPVIVLDYDGIFDESVYNALILIGDIMDTRERCDSLIAAMKLWQVDLEQRTKDIPEDKKPSVYAGAVSFKGGHGIEGTYGQFPPFNAIHANNVVDETDVSGALILEKEKLLIWNPDIIFLTPNNMGLVNEDYAKNPNYYQRLHAVQNNRIYAMINYNYYGTNIELAIADAYYAGRVIYPEAFSDIDFNAKADEIFIEMLGKSYLDILNTTGNAFGEIELGVK